MSRIVVLGGPRCGKTTLAGTLGIHPVKHTDDLIETHAWSEASDAVARWLDEPGPWVVEGVAAGRAIRKWLAAHPDGTPCDEVRVRLMPVVPLTPRQLGMLKSCKTVWNQIAPELVRRGVGIVMR